MVIQTRNNYNVSIHYLWFTNGLFLLYADRGRGEVLRTIACACAELSYIIIKRVGVISAADQQVDHKDEKVSNCIGYCVYYKHCSDIYGRNYYTAMIKIVY